MKQLLPIYALAALCLIGAFVLTILEKGAGLAGASAAAGFGVMTWATQREKARAEKHEQRARQAEDELFNQTGVRLPKE